MADPRGALIGAGIDRNDGESGVRGVFGTIADILSCTGRGDLVSRWALQCGIRAGWQAFLGNDRVDRGAGRLRPSTF